MDFRQRFLAISEYLRPYQRIWQNEIMLMYPTPLDGYPTEWVKEIAKIQDKADVMGLEKKEVDGLLKNPDLLKHYHQVETLGHFEKSPPHPSMPHDAFTFLYTIPKKQHEIKGLTPFVNHFYHELKVNNLVDIGGGIGLLAQALTNQYNLKVTSLDLDPVLQKTGLERHKKNAKFLDNLVTFEQVKVSGDNQKFLSLLTPQIATIGLHTCGPLAIDQMRASIKKNVKGLINFGCCYHKLKTDYNISSFAQTHSPLTISPFALTLASRAHRKLQEKDYDLKLKVKSFRYAFHFLLHDEYGIKELVTLGNSTPKLYNETFSTYALDQFKRINLTPKHSAQELDHYFNDQNRQNLIWDMLAAGILRNSFGRLIEAYILLDRALFLEEHGYKVDVFEFFDEEISPRNLGIVATHIPVQGQ